MKSNRRDFLKISAALALLPASLRKALAHPIAPRNAKLADVDHVVIFMQENRSFDHYFGSLRGVRGFNDPRAINLPNGKPVWFQPGGATEVTPFHLDTSKTSAQFMQSLDHSWKGSQERWRNHDAWIAAKTALTMGYFTRADIPFYYALADVFTICDAYHCSVFGPTNPNRLHLFSGTSGLTVGNDEVTAVDNPKDETNETADPANDAKAFRPLAWTTYAERLEKAGVSWRVYQEYDNYGDNALAYFRNFRSDVPASALHEKARSWAPGSNAANAKTSRGEHLVAQFAGDVAANRLPQVSWIVAPTIMSEHPQAPPSYGEQLSWQLLDALASNPEVWKRTVFFLTYDENDGFFDHVPPPIPATSPQYGASTVDTVGERYHGAPFGFGPRVPMLVVSPWSAGGYVNSEMFDHTSVIRFMERRFGVMEPNISPWRRAVAGDLTSTLRFGEASPLLLPQSGHDGLARADASHALPNAMPAQHSPLPRQEAGQRPHCALPYRLEVEGQCVANGFALTFTNKGNAGSVLRVSNADPQSGPWFITIETGKSLTYTIARAGAYDLRVDGPDGFFRRFAGGGDDQISVTIHADPPGDLLADIRNIGSEPAAVSWRNGYTKFASRFRFGPGQMELLSIPLTKQANWYDLTIEGPHGFVRQFSGHAEDGRHSLSDPLLA